MGMAGLQHEQCDDELHSNKSRGGEKAGRLRR
jgi:hypothetical protein